MDDVENTEKCMEKREKFGNRHLNEADDVFQHNAWDDVKWDEEQEKEAIEKVKANSAIKFPLETINKYENEADKYWDAFYDIHTNRFFKDRHWLFTEFPELSCENGAEKLTIFEIGCGVGNTIFPILQYSKSPNLFIYGADFSKKAIDVLKENEQYEEKRVKVFVLDATQKNWQSPFPENSIDIIVLIYVLSAINPDKFKNVVQNIYKYLKPGGLVLFRDYGRYDLVQLRFKPGRCIGENFYVRGDGTRVYFFTEDEIRKLFENFKEEEMKIDRRLQVNRGRFIKMYRVWLQAKWRK